MKFLYTVCFLSSFLISAGINAAEQPCADLEQPECQRQAGELVELQIETLYQEILAQITDPQAKAQLDAAQQAWQHSKQKDIYFTQLLLTRQRTEQLRAWLAKLANGETLPPEATSPLKALTTEKSAAEKIEEAVAEEETPPEEETAAVGAEETPVDETATAEETPPEEEVAIAEDKEEGPVPTPAETAKSKKSAASVTSKEPCICPVVTAKKQRKAPVWVVQLGSFRTEKQAQVLAKQLTGKGFTIRVVESGNWFAVRLPPNKRLQDAIKHLQQWERKTKYEEAIVVEIKNPLH